MEAVFLKILNMSITASWIVLAVIVMRLLLKKAPKWITVLMWGLAGVRLVCPFSLESVFSLIPSAETVPSNILYTDTPTIHSGVEAFNSVVNPIISESLAPAVGASVNPMQVITFAASIIWIAGVAAMSAYMAVSYLRIHKKVREAVPFKEDIWVCDYVDTPFILGVIRPRIYLPSAMLEQNMKYVVAHEKAHLKRRDYWWKLLGFFLLTIYWFNPILWIAYIFLCRDIELACDEKVIRDMGTENKKSYSDALINYSVPRRMIDACPLAFGEVGVKGRIKSVLNYKKPAFWVVFPAVLSCIVVAVCFLTNPIDEKFHAPEPFCHSYRVEEILYEAPQYSFTYTAGTAPRYQFTSDYVMFVSGDVLDDNDTMEWVKQYGRVEEVKITTQNFDNYFKTIDNVSGWKISNATWSEFRNSIERAWRINLENSENNVFYYLILTKSEDVYLAYGYDVDNSNDTAEEGSLIRWLFKLARTDILSCNVISEDYNAYIEPNYYPDGFDWEYENLTAGTINGAGILVFAADWDTDTLVVSEDYYRDYGESAHIEKETYTLTKNGDGKFELNVSFRGNRTEEAVYFIQAETGVYAMKIVFGTDEAPLGENDMSIGDVIPGTTYVSWQCLYMNPFSSYAAIGGDSGCKYVVGDDYFATCHRNDGSFASAPNPNPDAAGSGLQNIIDVPKWEWQEFPYTDDEWAALYQPSGIGGLENISDIYDEILYQPLTAKNFLLRVDGNLWLVQLSSNPQMGTYLWSIYSLVLESAMGVVQ